MTGGLQEQVKDKDGFYCGIPVWPASKAVIGSQEVPYIYEDRVNKDEFIAALVQMHNVIDLRPTGTAFGYLAQPLVQQPLQSIRLKSLNVAAKAALALAQY
jgi:hypothetical protein